MINERTGFPTEWKSTEDEIKTLQSQNKCAMRNVTARAVYHSCHQKSSGSGGEGHTFEDRANDRA